MRKIVNLRMFCIAILPILFALPPPTTGGSSLHYIRRDFDRSRFGLVRNRSDFDSSGSVNRKRVYGSVCDQLSEQSS